MINTGQNEELDLNGKDILITGGTGSFGRRFAKTILKQFQPNRLIIFSRDEHKQFDMANEMREHENVLRFFIGDVRDPARLDIAFRGVDYVIHAAALKHVTIAEYNPFECIQTNVVGAEQIVLAAIKNNIKRVVALSTDKACSPINLYGASKLASDKIFTAAGSVSGRHGPRFSVVRYGNVVGSRGSVVPFFKSLIKNDCRELPITDPRMTRFWISLQHGVDFVLSSMNIMRGGEIFVPKIPSMNIMDLAGAIAPGMPTTVVGIRPGEKLHEIMISEDDARNTLELEDRYVLKPSHLNWTPEGNAYAAARPVDPSFFYDSATNTSWLTKDDLSRMITELESY